MKKNEYGNEYDDKNENENKNENEKKKKMKMNMEMKKNWNNVCNVLVMIVERM